MRGVLNSMPTAFCGELCSFRTWDGLQAGLVDGVLYGFLFGLTAAVALELGLLAQLVSAGPVGQASVPVPSAQKNDAQASSDPGGATFVPSSVTVAPGASSDVNVSIPDGLCPVKLTFADSSSHSTLSFSFDKQGSC